MSPSPARRNVLFARSPDDRIVAGVSGGIARSLGVDANVVRLAFVLLTLASALGLVVYGLAYALSEAPRGEAAAGREVTQQHTLGFVCIVVGVLVLLNRTGIVFVPALIIPVALVLGGAAVAWGRSPLQELISGRHAMWRLLAGGAVLIVGVGVFLTQSNAFASLWSALLAVTATVVGLSLLLAPWLFRLGREVSYERRERIRSETRAEMSAHLHDSVLHTLALIQRSDASSDVITLARRQERELRAWMQGRDLDIDERLRDAIEALTNRVESAHRVSVDAVVVGDTYMDERVHAFVQAVQEATVNAARHSGVDVVSVYVEADRHEVTAFIRDQGHGFDASAVPEDRRGIVDSIEGRMRRAGGRADIRSVPREGTEVELHLPLGASRG